MSWVAIRCTGIAWSANWAASASSGRPSGAELPEHLLADEHHQTLDGQKVYVATTVGCGCLLGAEPAATAGTDDLKDAYSVFKDEALDVAPRSTPKTVNTDGWKGTKAAWKALFQGIVILQCFLHAWLKIRERGKHLKDQFGEVSRRAWEAYHAPDRRCFGQRLRSLRGWAKRISAGSSWRRSSICARSGIDGRSHITTREATGPATCSID